MNQKKWSVLVRTLRAINGARLDNSANAHSRLGKCSGMAYHLLVFLGESPSFPYMTHSEQWEQSDEELERCYNDLLDVIKESEKVES